MYVIQKSFNFEYAHRLSLHKGKCFFLHGHSGVIKICLKSDGLNENGMIMDFGMLKQIVNEEVIERLDHSLILNVEDHMMIEALMDTNQHLIVLPFEPTSENLAKWLYDMLKKKINDLYSITFYETKTACATYRE